MTSGGSPIDMSKTLIVYSSPNVTPTDLLSSTTTANATLFQRVAIYNDLNTNEIIDKGEKFEIKVAVDDLDNIGPNDDFQIEVKPPQGATYTVHRKAPPAISAVMSLN